MSLVDWNIGLNEQLFHLRWQIEDGYLDGLSMLLYFLPYVAWVLGFSVFIRTAR
jgi:hypothetical protein